MKRALSNLAAGLSLLLCAAACVLWVRGRAGTDEVAWTYDRYRPDRSAASTQVYLTSDRRLWLSVNWGHVGPYNGQLVWGYYVNADQSGGRPQFRVRHEPYDTSSWVYLLPNGNTDAGSSGVGPLRWSLARRSPPKDGDHFVSLRLGLSHWLAALLLLVPPALWLRRFRKERRARMIGRCRGCGYDLRATPDRCPECGRTPAGRTMAGAPC